MYGRESVFLIVICLTLILTLAVNLSCVSGNNSVNLLGIMLSAAWVIAISITARTAIDEGK